MSISKTFIPIFLCVFSQIKDRKHIEQNFHSVAKVMPRGGTEGCLGSQNFTVGYCDGAPSTARSSFGLQKQLFCYWRSLIGIRALRGYFGPIAYGAKK